MELNDLKFLEEIASKEDIPIIGREKGRWLLEQVQKENPSRILEIGTAIGYSGVILGSLGGHVICLELSEDAIPRAKKAFEKFNIDYGIILGDAVETIKALDGDFDMIFIDFDKAQYISVLEDCIRLCKKGGVIIADNMSFPEVQEFKEKVLNDSRLDSKLIPIKDGMIWSRKK